jgi:signal peptidase I
VNLAKHLIRLLAVCLVLVGSSGVGLVFRAIHVQGSSMAPSLGSGEILLVNRAAFVFGGPHRGDVVVFRSPTSEPGDFVKRVIGVPGDTVLVKAGDVFVNGQLMSEPYVKLTDDYTYPLDGQPVTVPAGAYFVLGDNRRASNDSHMGWFVPADNLWGTAFVLPLSAA